MVVLILLVGATGLVPRYCLHAVATTYNDCTHPDRPVYLVATCSNLMGECDTCIVVDMVIYMYNLVYVWGMKQLCTVEVTLLVLSEWLTSRLYLCTCI